MSRIKGWRKKTKKSWINKNSGAIISYDYQPSSNIHYHILVNGITIDSRDTLEEAKKTIYYFMRNGLQGIPNIVNILKSGKRK